MALPQWAQDLNRAQAAFGGMRGPLGGRLDPSESDLFRQFLQEPEWAWPFVRSMCIGGPGYMIKTAVHAADPDHDLETPPSKQLYLRALECAVAHVKVYEGAEQAAAIAAAVSRRDIQASS